MKKLLFLAIAALLLLSCAAADSLEYDGPCPHECIIMQKGYISDLLHENELTEVSGKVVCQICGESFQFLEDKSVEEPEPCEQNQCIHRVRRLPYIIGEGWYPAEETYRLVHEYRKYYLGQCIDCDLMMIIYEPALTTYGNRRAEHQFEETDGFHIEGTHIHVVYEKCIVCGYIKGGFEPCIEYTNGYCEWELNKRLNAMGAE